MEDFTTIKYATNNYVVTIGNFIGDSLFVTPAASSYQWFKDNTLLVGETQHGINLDTAIYGNGNYHCQITQYCTEYYSDTFPAMTVSVKALSVGDQAFSISYNYDNKIVEIRCHQEIRNLNIDVFDITGNLIRSEVKKSCIEGSLIHFPFLHSGIYFVRLSYLQGQLVKKIVALH